MKKKVRLTALDNFRIVRSNYVRRASNFKLYIISYTYNMIVLFVMSWLMFETVNFEIDSTQRVSENVLTIIKTLFPFYVLLLVTFMIGEPQEKYVNTELKERDYYKKKYY